MLFYGLKSSIFAYFFRNYATIFERSDAQCRQIVPNEALALVYLDHISKSW